MQNLRMQTRILLLTTLGGMRSAGHVRCSSHVCYAACITVHVLTCPSVGLAHPPPQTVLLTTLACTARMVRQTAHSW